MTLVVGSLLLVPIIAMVHPDLGQLAHDFFIPGLPAGSDLSTVTLLIIGIVGTTIAPWQLFFQQSYVIDKRITPRYMRYEKIDLWLGIVIVIISAGAIMGFTAATTDTAPPGRRCCQGALKTAPAGGLVHSPARWCARFRPDLP